MNESNRWLIAPVAMIAPALLPTSAFAVDYLSFEQAQRALFPEASAFIERPLNLSGEQRKVIASASPTRTRLPERVWEVRRGDQRIGWF
ncbi:MAG TPA: hypothetical protein VFS42_11785, partial [Burkholderiaceae bacterium]|nr:hypothetical protein [Burkholderiaceae bacterium]